MQSKENEKKFSLMKAESFLVKDGRTYEDYQKA